MKTFEFRGSENIEGGEASFEVMKTPEIVVQEERSAQLFSLLLKAEDPNWGETETDLAKETVEYFKNNPLGSEIVDTMRGFHEQGVDEETLYNLALTYEHLERAEKVFEMAAKYKPHVKKPQEIHRKLLETLNNFDQIFSNSTLAKKFALEIEGDRRERINRLKETRQRIEALIDFFKPNFKTSDIKKVSFVPTDPLRQENSGSVFLAFPGEQIIISHIDNVDNQDHEFAHGIINPIVEKLSQQLTSEQKEKIVQLSSEKLKQDYGEEHFSLLCEEFIRTYIDVFRKGERSQTYENFAQKISGITEDEFQQYLLKNENFKKRCEELEVQTVADFKNKSQDYFKRFEMNQLRDLVFEMYKEYEGRSNKEENFEQFILARFQI